MGLLYVLRQVLDRRERVAQNVPPLETLGTIRGFPSKTCILQGGRKARTFHGLFCCLCVSFTALAQQPHSSPPTDDLSRASALINEGKPDQALTLLNQLVRNAPTTPGLQKCLGKAYYEEHDFSTAAAHLRAALNQDPHDPEVTQLLGLSYYYLHEPRKGIPLIEKVQSLLPHPSVDAAYVLGASYLETFDYDKARMAFAQMFSVPAASAQAYVVLAQMMMHRDLNDQAVPELQHALAIDPHVPMAHFLLGEVYLFRSHVQEALEEFKAERAINPTLWLAYWRMGDAYNRLGKLDEAESSLKQAIWLNQNFSGPYILLGQIELKKGDPQLAAGFLKRALKMDPNNFDAHYNLGLALTKLGRGPDAQQQFELAQKLRAASH
jgi:tetratricopeptide (TPR) repeat protein